MIYRYDLPQCLNGWWDIMPIYDENQQGEWEIGKFLVPSTWNQSPSAIRMPGETYYSARKNMDEVASSEADNLFDVFGYPHEWTRAKSIYVRRNLTIVKKEEGKRYFLILEAAGPKTDLYINGQFVIENHEYMLPLITDITEYIHNGDNEIKLKLSDYDRNQDGKTLWPSGNGFTNKMHGIWQDVYLIEKNDIYIEDITIETSVRKHEITLKYVIQNTTSKDETLILSPSITEFKTGNAGIDFPEITIHAQKNTCTSVSKTISWEDPNLWDNFNPNLYWLDTTLTKNGEILDTAKERFGFREIWIEKDKIMLNSHPIHLFYDWGHKETCYNHTKGWILGWFQMMRDFHYNGARLHTHPHPQLIMELADEYGIFITGETGIHGAGGAQAASLDVFWENAQKHVAAFVKRDKNHPSVILWSCENEMRWNADGIEKTKLELPKIKQLFNQLDQTRIAYHDGDSSFWNEKRQDLISRHYGKECTGFGWWDHTRPLHSGEMSMHHYASPNNALNLVGDRGWKSYENVNEAATLDFLYIAEDARANGVCCLGPWNLSCLVNLREHEAQELTYEDYTAPGVKPLYVKEGSSEFEFWTDKDKKYVPQPKSENFKAGFRPFAVIDLSRRSNYYPESFHKRTLTLVNDTNSDKSGTLHAEIIFEGKIINAAEEPFSVKRGAIQKIDLDLTNYYFPGNYEYKIYAQSGDEILDSWSRKIHFGDRPKTKVKNRIAVYSDLSIEELLNETGTNYRFVDNLDHIEENILIIGRNQVKTSGEMNRKVQKLLQAGKKVIVLNQNISLFPNIKLTDLSVQTANIRNYNTPVLNGITDQDLRFWGDDPFSLLSGDTFVANKLYIKDDGSYMNCILDAGEGNFGKGNLNTTPCFFAYEGEGIIIACQLNLIEKYMAVPAAYSLFINLIEFADGYQYQPNNNVLILNNEKEDSVKQAIASAKKGKTVLVRELTPNIAAIIENETGFNVKLTAIEDGFYNCVRKFDSPLLSGISNEDLCGIERITYAQAGFENFIIGDYLIKQNEDIKPLVVTAPKSAMKPLFVFGGTSELLRSYSLTKYVYHNDEEVLTVIGEISIGEGKLILSTFKPPYEKRSRFMRVKNQLIRNLYQKQIGESALEGVIPEVSGSSDGFPTFNFVFNQTLNEDLFQNMLESSIYQTERMNATPILALGGFEKVELGENELSADQFDLTKPILLYYTLESLIPRKNIGSNLGVPDPLAQTFLDIKGEGLFELWLNGKYSGKASAEDGICTFPDLEIERGYNHILILWTPRDKNSTCKTYWRNILRAPETGFLFTHTKSDV